MEPAGVSLYRSSIGKKALMAVTGLILLGFLIMHMVGNLKAFMGAESFNHYAEFLRTVGDPIFPRTVLLWLMRLALLFAVAVHAIFAIQLWRLDRRARRVDYRRYESLAISWASRTMLWGGLTILAFVVYHLLHLTFGSAHPDFRHGDAYHNLVSGFQNPIVVVAYLLALVPLGMHLYHGFWAAFKSLGASSPEGDARRRPIAAAIALVIVLGFAAVPIAVVAGVLRSEG